MRRALLAAALLLAGLAASPAQEGFPVGPTVTTNGTAAVGQLPGTATNDNAAAGKVGEYVVASGVETGQSQTSATVTITNASPAVITWGTTIPFATGSTITATCSVVNFTTSGGLPTGLTVGTNYYVGGASISGNTFSVATSCDNAIAGTYVNTSSAGSGTQTGVPTGILATGTQIAIGGMSLTAGDWDVTTQTGFLAGGTTSITILSTGNGLSIVGANSQIGRITQLTLAANVPGVSNNVMSSGPARYVLSGTTTIYCVASATFTVSTLAAWGGCRARRVR